RQRCPAHVIAAGAPRNPGRAPFATGCPDPSAAPQPDPASVVISCPAKVLVGNPGPAEVGVSPISIRVGPPACVAYGNARLPAVAVFASFDPASVVAEVIVKKIDRDIGPRFRLAKSRKGESQDRQC